jgi:hypothetical protein
MRRLAQLGLVLCLFVLAASWAATGPAAAGPAVLTAPGNMIVAAVKPICSIKDKCKFLYKLCVARCKCLGNKKFCLKQCSDKYRKCVKMVHTMECWDAARQMKLRAKYLKDCPKKPAR